MQRVKWDLYRAIKKIKWNHNYIELTPLKDIATGFGCKDCVLSFYIMQKKIREIKRGKKYFLWRGK